MFIYKLVALDNLQTMQQAPRNENIISFHVSLHYNTCVLCCNLNQLMWSIFKWCKNETSKSDDHSPLLTLTVAVATVRLTMLTAWHS